MLAPVERLSLSVRNLSTLSPDQSSHFGQTVEEEIVSRGHKVSHTESNETSLNIVLSQNLSSLLAVGELVQGNKSRVAVVRMDLTSLDLTAGNPSNVFTLSKELIWKQPGPLLDLKFLVPVRDRLERIAVLGLAEISIHEKSQTGWILLKRFPIPRAGIQARDPRGELFQIGDSSGFLLVAGVPGSFCFVHLDSEFNPSNLECNPDSENPFMSASLLTLGSYVIDNGAKWDSRHNYFSGDMFGESGSKWKIDPFYAGTFYSPRPGKVQDVFVAAGIDGRVHVMDHERKDLRTLTDLGSQLTTLHNSCDDGWYVLSSGRGDWTSSDIITAFQVDEGSLRVFENPIELAGPILSLGSAQIPADQEFKIGRDGSIAVIRNLKSGEYEAYRISTACSR